MPLTESAIVQSIASIAKPEAIADWLMALGVLTADTGSRAEAEMKLAAYVPLLAERFPAGAFTPASLEHVASKCRFFPAYADVVEHLGAWWLKHRPAPPALPPPPAVPARPAPTADEVARVAAAVREVAAMLHAGELWHASGAWPDEASRSRPAFLSPGLLDQINPLPNGRKRTDAAEATGLD